MSSKLAVERWYWKGLAEGSLFKCCGEAARREGRWDTSGP